MSEEGDILTQIQDKERELRPLFNRMDDDKALQYDAEYVMRDDKGMPVPEVHNVTLPHAPIVMGAKNGTGDTLIMVSAVAASTNLVGSYYIQGIGV